MLGGNRIPFARSNGAYAQASNQDMLTATLDGLVARFGLAGEPVGEVVGRRGAQAQPRLQPHPRGRARLAAVADHARLRRAAGLRHRPRGRRCSSPTRSPSGRSSRRSPAASTPRATRRSPSTTDLRQVLLALNRGQDARSSGSRRWRASGRARSCPRSRATPSRAPGCRWATTRPITALEWGITREAQDELTVASHRNLAAAYDRGFFDDLVTPLPRPDPRPEPAARLLGGEAGQAEAGVRQRATDATMTAGNSTPLTDGASAVLLGSRRVGRRARAAGARALRRRPDRGGRLRARRRGAADGAGVRRAAAARRAAG